MTITQMVQNQQQQRIGELAQRQQGKAHVNPYGTPGMSLNDAGDWRKIVPVDEGVVRQVKQIAFDHMKTASGSVTARTSAPLSVTIPCLWPRNSGSVRRGR